jgi:hypothetical protein
MKYSVGVEGGVVRDVVKETGEDDVVAEFVEGPEVVSAKYIMIKTNNE